MESLLNAIPDSVFICTKEEKKVQDKVNAKKAKGIPVKGKKDW